MEDPVAKAAADLTREFSYSINLSKADIFDVQPIKNVPPVDEATIRRQLCESFPELAWRDGEGNFGKIYLAGESQGTPPKVSISLLCKEPPGPFKLTIRLQNAGLIKAEELKDQVFQALPSFSLVRDPLDPFDDIYNSVPWVNAPQRHPRTTPSLPPVNRSLDSFSGELKIPVERPCVAIFQHGVEILLSRSLLEAMAVRAAELRTISRNNLTEEERLEMIRGARAKDILTAAMPTGTDGNSQLPLALLPQDARYLLGQLLQYGLAEVVHFNHHGMALSAKKVQEVPFGMRAGPTAGFGGVRFSIGFGKEILSLNTWVS